MSPSRFVVLFESAARQAGAVALHLQGEVRNRGKGPGSPESAALTAADLATQDVLLERLLDEAPDIALDAEEDTPLATVFPRDGERPLVVIDPIDGTLNYTRQSRDYAVMGSLIAEGVHQAAVVHFPAWGATWWAIRGGGCFARRGRARPERVYRPEAPPRLLLGKGPAERWMPALEDLGLQMSVSRCSAVDSSAPATGRARATLTAGHPDRRRAIGLLLTSEAGGVVRIGDRDWAGEDPDRMPDEGGPCLVADSAGLADRIAEALLTVA